MTVEELVAEIKELDSLQLAYEGVGLMYFADTLDDKACPLIRQILGVK